jgi:hypothetical protein
MLPRSGEMVVGLLVGAFGKDGCALALSRERW